MSDEEFAERVTAMTQTLYRVCYAQLSQACDREDAVQEALRKCWQKRGQLRDARYLQTWVIRVLLNECHNIQRRAARLQPCATLPERAAAPQPMGTTRVGEALLEVTQIGKECHMDCAIRKQVGDCVMPREGIFTVVVEEGTIKAGDKVEIVE